jgi:Antibiotic biosynthesis monooxygenase
MFVVLWEFEVKPGCQQRFEKVYSSGGDWASLFHRDPNHAATHLLRDAVRPGVYLTADYWLSREAYEGFRKAHHADYKSLDAASDDLTTSERHIGSYEVMGQTLPAR